MKRHIAILIALCSIALIQTGCKKTTAADEVRTWTAPGDDGNIGTAAEYDMRISDSMITEANWNLATPLTGLPTPSIAGTTETYTMAPLSHGIYFVAIKTRDDAFNWSALSNVVTLDIDNIEPSTITDLR